MDVNEANVIVMVAKDCNAFQAKRSKARLSNKSLHDGHLPINKPPFRLDGNILLFSMYIFLLEIPSRAI